MNYGVTKNPQPDTSNLGIQSTRFLTHIFGSWKDWELYHRDLIGGKKKGLFSRIVRGILWLISLVYRIGIICRNKAYDKGWFKCYSPPVPVVISVGNIVAGGTGKTPVTLMLAQQLYRKFPLAVLSRGYCSPAEHLQAPVILSKGDGPLYPSSYCGDEPYLLARNLVGSHVFVGRDRRKASMMAAKAGSRVIIIDDGMQHRSLARDFEVVVVDAGDPFGQRYFLPRGFLRDSLGELRRAHLIVLNNIRDRAQYLTAKHQLSRYTEAPIVATHPAVSAIYDPHGREIPTIKGKRIGLFCGIGRPDYFRHLVQTQEAYIVAEMITPDHIVPESDALNKFAQHCLAQGAELLLCTEKDKVKMNESFVCALPVSWVKIQLHVVEGHQHWNSFIEGIRNILEKDALKI